MVRPSFVKQFISEVTPDQIGACTKILDCQTHTNFYLVQSESDDQVEYKVTYSSKGFQCSCPSGQHGFSNTKHGFCKHVKWSVADAEEEKARETARLERIAAEKHAKSMGKSLCSTLDCLQLASTTFGQCATHNGKVTDPGMLAWMQARREGKDINHGAPAWMMR